MVLSSITQDKVYNKLVKQIQFSVESQSCFKSGWGIKVLKFVIYNSQHFNTARRLVDKNNLLACSLLYYIISVDGPVGKTIRTILRTQQVKIRYFVPQKSSLGHEQIRFTSPQGNFAVHVFLKV